MTNEDQAVKLENVDSRCKSNTRRIDELARSQEALTKIAMSVEVMATEQKHQSDAVQEIKRDVSKLDTKVDSIEKKPAKRWDAFVDKALWAVAAAVIAYCLARIGLT